MKKISLLAVVLFTYLFECDAQSILYIVSGNELAKVDIENCTTEVIGPLVDDIYDIAYNSLTDKLYGITYTTRLYEINTETAETRYIGNSLNPSLEVNSMTIDSLGNCFVFTFGPKSELHKINLKTGQSSLVGSTGKQIFGSGDLTFYKNKLYLATRINRISVIDTSDLSNSSWLGQFDNTFNELFGVTTHNCNSLFLAFDGNDIYDLNKDDLLDDPILLCEDVVRFTIFGAASTTEGLQCELASNTQNIDVNSIEVFPNPFKDYVIISSSGPLSKNASVELYDNTGRLLHLEKITQSESNIALPNITPGIYFVHVNNGENLPIVEKLVKMN